MNGVHSRTLNHRNVSTLEAKTATRTPRLHNGIVGTRLSSDGVTCLQLLPVNIDLRGRRGRRSLGSSDRRGKIARHVDGRTPSRTTRIPPPCKRSVSREGRRGTRDDGRHTHPLAISRLLISFLIFHISTLRSDVVSSPLVVISRSTEG